MFTEIASALYKPFLKKMPEVIVPQEYVNIMTRVMAKVGWDTRVRGSEFAGMVEEMPQNKKIMIALSGGLDSVYLMRQLVAQGYEVIAAHVAGLNKTAGKFETDAAERAARKAGAQFVKINFKAPRQAFPDNPFKNQLVLAFLMDIGIKKGIYRYAVGSDWTTPLSEAVVGFTITDSAEVYREFWEGVKARFPQAELVFIPDYVKKDERLRYLFEAGALDDVSSCVAPFRFRESLHNANIKKYGVQLMRGRCGSCYKCAMEYLLLVEMGLIPKNDKFYNHAWNTLATSKTAHRPDLFDKRLPLERRLENLKNYGS